MIRNILDLVGEGNKVKKGYLSFGMRLLIGM